MGKNSRGSVNWFGDFLSPSFRKVKMRTWVTIPIASKLFGLLQEGPSPSLSLPFQLRCWKRQGEWAVHVTKLQGTWLAPCCSQDGNNKLAPQIYGLQGCDQMGI